MNELAEQIRRQPQLAQTVNVAQLVQDLAGRWRQLTDMIDASEEVPVAAWIVRRKVEGLVRPELEGVEEAVFDAGLRPLWLDEAVGLLKTSFEDAARFGSRSAESAPQPLPAPVQDPSVWKILWSYPKLRVRPAIPVTVVRPSEWPLARVMGDWLDRLAGRPRLLLHEEMAGRPRQEWAAAFVAVVHLWHEQSVELTQEQPFAPLVIASVNPQKRRRPR